MFSTRGIYSAGYHPGVFGLSTGSRFSSTGILNCFSDPADYELTIHTGVVEGASAEVSLFVAICGTSGDTGRRRVRRLPRDSKVRLEAGGGGFHFTLANCINVGDVTHARVELGKDCWDSGVSWFMDSLSIEAIPILNYKGGGKNETGATKSLTFEKQRKLVDVVRPKMIRNDNCFFAIRPYSTRQTYFSVVPQSRSCKKCNYELKLNFYQETIKNGENSWTSARHRECGAEH